MSDGVPAMFDELCPGLEPDEQERRRLAENRAAAPLLKRLIRPASGGQRDHLHGVGADLGGQGRALGTDGGPVSVIIPAAFWTDLRAAGLVSPAAPLPDGA
ncbi:hypothetical protein AB0E77_22650 [Streptomyces sp. NPDC032940]|uniref:hypothetical protein n=1 Tax=Streptomyces sp. NPDC032940 TaxID=3155366 RepID=UPI0033CC5D75